MGPQGERATQRMLPTYSRKTGALPTIPTARRACPSGGRGWRRPHRPPRWIRACYRKSKVFRVVSGRIVDETYLLAEDVGTYCRKILGVAS